MHTERTGRAHRAARKALAYGTALLIATLGTIGLATPSTAASSDCPVGYACFWGDTGYRTDSVEDRLVKFYQCWHDLSQARYSGTSNIANDTATSVSNRGNHESARFYVNARYGGSSFLLAKGTGDGALNDSSGNAPGGYNDALSSGKFSSASTSCV